MLLYTLHLIKPPRPRSIAVPKAAYGRPKGPTSAFGLLRGSNQRGRGGLVPGHVARQDQRGGAHAVGLSVARLVRRLAVLGEPTHRLEQPPPHGDDRQVGAAQVLDGPVAHRAHALLDRQVLLADAANTRVRAPAALVCTIDQIVVVLVAHG